MLPSSTLAIAPSPPCRSAISFRLLPLTLLLVAVTLPAATALNVHENPLDDPLGIPAFGLDLFAKAVTEDEIKHIPQDERLVSPSGLSFYCPPPAYDPGSSQLPTASVADPRTEEQVIADAMRLLKPLKMQPCLSIEQGWWRYDYCHERDVSQIHEFGEKMPPAKYVLGQYGRGEDKPELHVKAGKRYVSIRYRGGDVCDETGRPRTVEIQYHCSESASSDRLSLVQETALCNYHVTLFSPRLCADPAMAKPTSTLVHTQACHLVVDNKESIDIWSRESKLYLPHLRLGVLTDDAFLPRSVLAPRVSGHDRAKARPKAAAAGAGEVLPGLILRTFVGERTEPGGRMGASSQGDAQGMTSPPNKRKRLVTPGGDGEANQEEPALSDVLVEIAESFIRKYKDHSSSEAADQNKKPAGTEADESERGPHFFFVSDDGMVPLNSRKGADRQNNEAASVGKSAEDERGKDAEGDDEVDGLEPESPLLFEEMPI